MLGKTNVFVKVGKYSQEPEMAIANIKDECILEVDFLSKVGLKQIFYFSFETLKQIKENQDKFICSRIEKTKVDVLGNSSLLFKEQSKKLNFLQKDIFAEFLNKVRDVFSKEIVTGTRVI